MLHHHRCICSILFTVLFLSDNSFALFGGDVAEHNQRIESNPFVQSLSPGSLGSVVSEEKRITEDPVVKLFKAANYSSPQTDEDGIPSNNFTQTGNGSLISDDSMENETDIDYYSLPSIETTVLPSSESSTTTESNDDETTTSEPPPIEEPSFTPSTTTTSQGTTTSSTTKSSTATSADVSGDPKLFQSDMTADVDDDEDSDDDDPKPENKNSSSPVIWIVLMVIEILLTIAFNLVSLFLCLKMKGKCGGLRSASGAKSKKNGNKVAPAKNDNSSKSLSQKPPQSITQKEQAMKKAASPSSVTSMSQRNSKVPPRKGAGHDPISYGIWSNSFESYVRTSEMDSFTSPLDYLDAFFGIHHPSKTVTSDTLEGEFSNEYSNQAGTDEFEDVTL